MSGKSSSAQTFINVGKRAASLASPSVTQSGRELANFFNSILTRIITVFPLCVIVYGFLSWMILGTDVYMYFFLGAIANETLNRFLKIFFGNIFNTSCFVYRPVGSTNCSYMSSCKDVDKPPDCLPVGFPGETTQSYGYLFSFWIIYLVDNSFERFGERATFMVLILIYVIYDRITKRCNTPMQVISGLIVGSAFGALWYMLTAKD